MRVRALIGVLLLSGLTMGIGRGVHDDSPQGCVKAYLDALNSKDLKAALDLLVTAKNATPGDVKSMMPPGAGYELQSTKVYGEGDDVIVAADVNITGGEKYLSHDLFHVTKSDGHWKIIPLDLGHMSTPPASLIAAILGSDMYVAKQAAEKTECLSNVKQLNLGNLMYANDYDDVMPISEKWKSGISPYVKNQSLFHCPDDKRPNAVSYRMSDLLSKVKSASLGDPAAMILIYEGEDGQLTPRHVGKGNVGFADGHAKGVDLADFAKGYRKP